MNGESTVLLYNSYLLRNEAGTNGGGIYIGDLYYIYVISSYLMENTATVFLFLFIII